MRLALLHLGEIKGGTLNADAVSGEFTVNAVPKFAGLQQRLRRNAARIQTGSTKGVSAVAVLPTVDANRLQAVLAGADGCRITGRTTTNNNNVVMRSHDLNP